MEVVATCAQEEDSKWDFIVLLQQNFRLSDSVLMELARLVPGRDIESLVLEKLGIEQPRIRNLRDSRRDDIEMFTFDVLCLWKNISVENAKEVMESLTKVQYVVSVEEKYL